MSPTAQNVTTTAIFTVRFHSATAHRYFHFTAAASLRESPSVNSYLPFPSLAPVFPSTSELGELFTPVSSLPVHYPSKYLQTLRTPPTYSLAHTYTCTHIHSRASCEMSHKNGDT
ncbi:hypothetical protein WUBG_03410 [Wuchereria bancrofti]|uniref:Uncharacterized protein n=1 Tax=Wuchereria bancrofti TaxID=6293 RepID=J9F823_WUCBA|nr:hypothetical protein WUBG_03410 [Wuchereria bancrofti]